MKHKAITPFKIVRLELFQKILEAKQSISVILIFLSILFITACGTYETSTEHIGDAKHTNVAFSLSLEDKPGENLHKTPSSYKGDRIGDEVSQKGLAKINCDTSFITNMEVSVYDSLNTKLVEKSFPCNTHSGTIQVPSGDNRRFVFSGKNAIGEELYYGKSSGIDLEPGATYNMGEIIMNYVGETHPSTPTGVTVAAGDGQVTLSWNTVSDATSYNIYWSTMSGVTKTTGTKISNVTSPYTHTGLTNGTTYYYVVTAVNSNGESNESIQVSVTPSAIPSQATPTGVTVAAGDGQVTLSWNTVSDATSYNIYWSTMSGVTKTTGTKISNVTSPYTHTGLTNGTTYYYVVTAVNSNGESNESIQVSVTPSAIPSQAYSFYFKWGTLGTAPGELYHPASITTDNDNNVYVMDGGNSRIQKFTGDGTFVSVWPGFGPGFITVKNNTLYLLGTTSIKKYDLNGNYVGEIPVGGSYFYIDEQSGDIYITKYPDNLVLRYDANGNLIGQWGGLGTGNGKFDGVRSITFDNSGNVLVGDAQYSSQQSRIQKFDKNGNYIDSFQTGNGIYPECIAVDKHNRILISNIGAGSKIDVYDENYNFLQAIDGSNDTKFKDSPPLFTVGSNEYLYVSDYGNNGIQVFKPFNISTTPLNLPKTGQVTCYDESGNIIGCTGTGQDGDLHQGVAWPSPRFTDNGDGTVTDNLTGLIWTKDGNAPGSSACSPATTKTWQGALDYVACLNTNSYLGYTDWRLPNVNELKSLVHAGQSNISTWLNTQGFNNVQSGGYWSSTSVAYSPDYAWVVGMWDGYMGDGSKASYGHVWPVRSGQSWLLGNSIISIPKTGQTTCYDSSGNVIACTGMGQDGDLQQGVAWPSPRFTDNGDGTVTDNLTGLIWTKDGNAPGSSACSPATTKTWQGALDYVACLNTNSYLGYTDWRLPNVNELKSLVHAGQSNISTWLNTQGFNNVQSYYYWSATSYAGSPYDAWIVHMWNGYVFYNH